MPSHLPSRRLQRTTFAALLTAALCAASLAQPGQRRGPTAPSHPPLGPQRNHEHIAQWMQEHSRMSLPEQQRALEREPGFHDLSPQVQQRMRDRLTQLNNMSPERRQRIIARTEAMERLTPQQRQEVRGTMAEVSSLPPDRRSLVIREYRSLRGLPPDQRQAALNSDRIRSNFSPQERSTLNNLVSIEPYIEQPSPSH